MDSPACKLHSRAIFQEQIHGNSCPRCSPSFPWHKFDMLQTNSFPQMCRLAIHHHFCKLLYPLALVDTVSSSLK
ncbi:hypothetical protein OIU78_020018 [Salix suchowensis]|nr:hypothetical protein OIU78_020018 [Salix suchowensis]